MLRFSGLRTLFFFIYFIYIIKWCCGRLLAYANAHNILYFFWFPCFLNGKYWGVGSRLAGCWGSRSSQEQGGSSGQHPPRGRGGKNLSEPERARPLSHLNERACKILKKNWSRKFRTETGAFARVWTVGRFNPAQVPERFPHHINFMGCNHYLNQ